MLLDLSHNVEIIERALPPCAAGSYHATLIRPEIRALLPRHQPPSQSSEESGYQLGSAARGSQVLGRKFEYDVS
uniref:Uncharacterized protein n=1 Tax=Oryza punctata TaxID=4537 RepID=A0A0E0L922_ORYPU